MSTQRFPSFGISISKNTSVVLLALCLFTFATGCKKPVKPPPPPPSPPTSVKPPTPSAPVISSFTAEPTSIERGQSATLRWSISGATDMTVDQGLGAVQSSGSRSVYPSSTTTYTLTANGPGGSDTKTVTIEVRVAQAPPPPPTPPTSRRSGSDILGSEAQDAYFDYDKSDVRGDATGALQKDADVLKRIFTDDPSFKVVIEGHCDERGSAEYNLGLGDRRATAAKEFLVQQGVAADKLQIISYGKDKPQCTDAAEGCYQKNRRAHLSPAQ